MTANPNSTPAPDQTIATHDAPQLVAGRYRIVKALGAGGMGEVFLAEDQTLNRPVALKTIRQDLCTNEQIRKRIERECLLHAKVGAHPNIVTLYDKLEENGRIQLVMEFVTGETLQSMLEANMSRDTPFTWDQAQAIVTQCLDALSRIHANGIIHRDIKPSNILISHQDGHLQAKLMDFGIARVDDTSDDSMTKLTSTNAVSPGTPMYMAPEQIDSRTYGAVGQSTDIYAMGIVLYQCLNGYPPYTGTLTEILNGHLNAPVPPFASPRTVMMPAQLPSVLSKSLAKLPQDRFESARAFRDALVSMQGSNLVAAQTVLTPNTAIPRPLGGATLPSAQNAGMQQAKPRSGPSAMMVGLAVAFVLVVFAATGWGVWTAVSVFVLAKSSIPEVSVASGDQKVTISSDGVQASTGDQTVAIPVEHSDQSAPVEPAPEPAQPAPVPDTPAPAVDTPVVADTPAPDPELPTEAVDTSPDSGASPVDGTAVPEQEPPPVMEPESPSLPDTHQVATGETLSKIAAKYALNADTLAYWNDISDPSLLAVGDTLALKRPDGKSETPPVAAVKPSPKPATTSGTKQDKPIPASSEAGGKEPAKPAEEPATEWESVLEKRWERTDPNITGSGSPSGGGSAGGSEPKRKNLFQRKGK
ncbi:MAG: hypothetical protein AMXMBFR84_05890 [Candidatus Hydrogenedentota bacterium]